MKYTDVEWLKDNHKSLAAFGLGFLQLKLNDSERLHFWHPDFVREREEVHDHRYDFTSLILGGRMTQQLYELEFSVNPTHELFTTDCKPGSAGTETILKYGSLKKVFSCENVASAHYTISHGTLHRISADQCVMFLTRGLKVKDAANVVREIGATSTCPFADTVPESEMWAMIADLLKSCI
jgi:hypothetical protein